MDHLTPSERSRQMALVRHKDTKPEMAVRRLIHAMGFRFRLHDRRLPGCPDLVFPRHKKVIFVNGCFWHGHASSSCKRGRLPKTRTDYWEEKLRRNRQRDIHNLEELRRRGWQSHVVWECQIGNGEQLENELREFFSSPRRDEP